MPDAPAWRADAPRTRCGERLPRSPHPEFDTSSDSVVGGPGLRIRTPGGPSWIRRPRRAGASVGRAPQRSATSRVRLRLPNTDHLLSLVMAFCHPLHGDVGGFGNQGTRAFGSGGGCAPAMGSGTSAARWGSTITMPASNAGGYQEVSFQTAGSQPPGSMPTSANSSAAVRRWWRLVWSSPSAWWMSARLPWTAARR